MRDIMGMMGKVKEMQERMQTMQAELQEAEVEGSSGGGMVTVITNGKGELRSVKIDPSLLKPDEAEIIEDLIVAAANDAKAKAEATIQERMSEITGGLPLPPGMKLF
ncbi:MAG: YbaB/EbfC family nucleoid-associated protein [Pseudomonadota bacterium]